MHERDFRAFYDKSAGISNENGAPFPVGMSLVALRVYCVTSLYGIRGRPVNRIYCFYFKKSNGDGLIIFFQFA